MGNPYTSQAISGYNTNPPSDDGSETAANTVTWAKHKSKLTDPLKTLAEAINTQCVAAFGKVLGQTFISKSSDYTIQESDIGSVVLVTGTTTITLLAAATAGDGFPLIVHNNGAAAVTIDGNSSETINGNTTIVLWPGDFVVLTCDGSAWAAAGRYVVAGSFTPTYSGFSADPSGDIDYFKRDGRVWIRFPEANGTSNSSGFTISNLPAAITPASDIMVAMPFMHDAGAPIAATVQVRSSNILTFFAGGIVANWTASGAKGFDSGSGKPVTSYPLFLT